MPMLGRVPGPEDQRDALFPMSLNARLSGPLPTSRYWYPGMTPLDQDGVGACVGFTGANWLQNSPARSSVVNKTGFDLYAECKKIDGIPNTEGTYARVLLKVLQAQGYVARYLWAQDGLDLKSWVLGVGPVMVGTPWTDDMFDPDADGFVHPTGNIAGGHEYLVRGYSRPLDAYRCRNSWSNQWGIGEGSRWAGNGGEFWIKRVDLDDLVFGHNWGDAVGIEQARV